MRKLGYCAASIIVLALIGDSLTRQYKPCKTKPCVRPFSLNTKKRFPHKSLYDFIYHLKNASSFACTCHVFQQYISEKKKPQQFPNINFLKYFSPSRILWGLLPHQLNVCCIFTACSQTIFWQGHNSQAPFNWTVTESLTHHIWPKAISSRLHLQECPNINKCALYCHSALAHPAYNSSTADIWRSGLFAGPKSDGYDCQQRITSVKATQTAWKCYYKVQKKRANA